MLYNMTFSGFSAHCELPVSWTMLSWNKLTVNFVNVHCLYIYLGKFINFLVSVDIPSTPIVSRLFWVPACSRTSIKHGFRNKSIYVITMRLNQCSLRHPIRVLFSSIYGHAHLPHRLHYFEPDARVHAYQRMHYPSHSCTGVLSHVATIGAAWLSAHACNRPTTQPVESLGTRPLYLWLNAHLLGESLAMQVMWRRASHTHMNSVPGINSWTTDNGRDIVPRSTFRRGDSRRPCSPSESGPTTAGKLFCATEGSACVETDPRKEQGRKHGLRYRDHKRRPWELQARAAPLPWTGERVWGNPVPASPHSTRSYLWRGVLAACTWTSARASCISLSAR